MACKEGKFPLTYLGLPLSDKIDESKISTSDTKDEQQVDGVGCQILDLGWQGGSYKCCFIGIANIFYVNVPITTMGKVCRRKRGNFTWLIGISSVRRKYWAV